MKLNPIRLRKQIKVEWKKLSDDSKVKYRELSRIDRSEYLEKLKSFRDAVDRRNKKNEGLNSISEIVKKRAKEKKSLLEQNEDSLSEEKRPEKNNG